MINSYVSVLTVYLPSAAQLNNFSHTISFRLVTVLKKVFKNTPKLLLIKPFLYQKQLGSRLFWPKVIRVPLVIVLILFFLFIGPHTSILANWEEKVIPDNRSVLQTKLADRIGFREIPKFQKPVESSYISTYFSRFHQGLDLPSLFATPIYPVAEGQVTFAGMSNMGYGNLVIVRHEQGYESLYAHLSDISVKEGDSVTTRTVLGGVGSTGYSSGNHLHLEIHLQGFAINPLTLIK